MDRFGYTNNLCLITAVNGNWDCKLWKTITENPSHPLFELFPPKRQRSLRDRGYKESFCWSDTLCLIPSTLSFSIGTTELGGRPFSSCITVLAYFMT